MSVSCLGDLTYGSGLEPALYESRALGDLANVSRLGDGGARCIGVVAAVGLLVAAVDLLVAAVDLALVRVFMRSSSSVSL